jgi:hypothetical protein
VHDARLQRAADAAQRALARVREVRIPSNSDPNSRARSVRAVMRQRELVPASVRAPV